MKSLKNILETSILADIEGSIDYGNKVINTPEVALNIVCKNFKELVEVFANYFGVKSPKIQRKDIKWSSGYKNIYSIELKNAYYVKFDVNDPNTGKHIIELADGGNRPFAHIKVATRFYDNILHNRKETFTSVGENPYWYGERSVYDWIMSKDGSWYESFMYGWINFNQNPG